VPTTYVGRQSGIGWGRKLLVGSTLPGRLAWVVYRRRQVPRRLLRTRARGRAEPERSPAVSTPPKRRSFRGGVIVAVAPGERAGLVDLLESLRHHEGDDIKVVVADDHTDDYLDERFTGALEGVDFVRPVIPSGHGLCAFRTLQAALLHMVRNYELPTILKVDSDSMIIAPGAFDLASARFRADGGVGILGSVFFEPNASGAPTDFRWESWMAHPELRWSPTFRRLVRAAERRLEPLRFAHAGAYFLSRAAVDAMLAQGVLPFHQPQWSLQVDDVIMGLIIQAAGLRVGSFGAPGDPVASISGQLPLEPPALLEGGFKVVHSVRRSPGGLGEAEIRGYFRAARSGAAQRAPPRDGYETGIA
jgi:hypothetical protein